MKIPVEGPFWFRSYRIFVLTHLYRFSRHAYPTRPPFFHAASQLKYAFIKGVQQKVTKSTCLSGKTGDYDHGPVPERRLGKFWPMGSLKGDLGSIRGRPNLLALIIWCWRAILADVDLLEPCDGSFEPLPQFDGRLPIQS